MNGLSPQRELLLGETRRYWKCQHLSVFIFKNILWARFPSHLHPCKPAVMPLKSMKLHECEIDMREKAALYFSIDHSSEIDQHG